MATLTPREYLFTIAIALVPQFRRVTERWHCCRSYFLGQQSEPPSACGDFDLRLDKHDAANSQNFRPPLS